MPKSAAFGCGFRASTRSIFVLTLAGATLLLSGCGNTGASAAADATGGGGGGKGGRKGGGGDVPVTVARANAKDVPVEIQVIGNVEAYNNITVKALVGGELNKVHFEEGDFVK